jgi:hypothetical protein
MYLQSIILLNVIFSDNTTVIYEFYSPDHYLLLLICGGGARALQP